MYDGRCRMYDGRCKMYDGRCKMYDIRCTMCDVRWTMNLSTVNCQLSTLIVSGKFCDKVPIHKHKAISGQLHDFKRVDNGRTLITKFLR